MLEAGDTTVDDPVIAPGFQVYVLAPVAVKVELCPTQMVAGVAAKFNVGVGLTVTATVPLPVHPAVVVPATVNVVVTLGVTVAVIPEIFPGFQV